jgi:hypothetical protein
MGVKKGTIRDMRRKTIHKHSPLHTREHPSTSAFNSVSYPSGVMSSQESLTRKNGRLWSASLVDAVRVEVLAAQHDGCVDINFEVGLGASVRFNDVLAKLVRVVSDAQVESVVMPITVEDGLEVEARAVERQLEELGSVGPVGDVFIGLRDVSQ